MWGDDEEFEHLDNYYPEPPESNYLAPPDAGTLKEQGHTYEEVRDAAQSADGGWSRCFIGKEVVFYYPDTEARDPGHIYSQDGLAEYKISQTCEYHFDQIAREWEESYNGEEEDV